MKKEYMKPKAEMVQFDYVETVVACPSGCSDPSHSWHAGQVYGSCNGNNNYNNNNNNNNNNNSNNNSGGNSYWAVAWGQPCS